MEKESNQIIISEGEFLELLKMAKNNDKKALLELIQFFEQDINQISRFIRLPREDVKQSIITEMIDLFKNRLL
jgi:hypothetical protein